MLFQFYLLALAAALVTAGLFVLAGQGAGLARDYGPMPVGHGVSVPPHTEVAGAPPWLALNFTLVADGTLFTYLLFGTLYLWISAPNWPPAAAPEPDLMLALVAVAVLAGAAAGARIVAITRRRRYGERLDRPRHTRAPRSHCRGPGLIGGVVPPPTEHAHGATAAALLGYVALHAGIGILFLVSNLLRLGAGLISPRRSLDLRLTRLWIDYTVFTGAIALGLLLALPALVEVVGTQP